jgi:hypothetical protein
MSQFEVDQSVTVQCPDGQTTVPGKIRDVSRFGVEIAYTSLAGRPTVEWFKPTAVPNAHHIIDRFGYLVVTVA